MKSSIIFSRQSMSVRTALRSNAFTLVELLVVIAIIGILSSVVLASLGTARAKARDSKRVSDIKQLQLALELFADNCYGQYPNRNVTSGALSASSDNTVCNSINLGTFQSTIPVDPVGSANYVYAYPSSGGAYAYHLGTALELSNASVGGDANFSSASGYTGGFDGATVDCGVAGWSTRAQCYDVKNQ